jgi:pimeloyl-ACP methyl ester carboxylesterase
MLVVRAGIVAAMLLCGCSMPASYPNVHEEEVRLGNGDVTLAGTLYLPAGSLPHPAVVIFHGSGPQARDSLMGHWFAEQGIACLTYDKRGVGESTGDFQRVAFPALVDDGLAAISFLKTRAGIDPRRIGVWGLSQGGWLGPLAASRSKDVAFVIAVSGPGVSPGEQMIFYYANQLRDRGLTELQVAEASDLRRQVWHYLSTGEGYAAADKTLHRAESQPWFAAIQEQQDGLFHRTPVSGILKDSSLRQRLWFKAEVNYDPRIALRKLTVPVLFVFGEKDQLVPVQTSIDIIRRTLTESGHRDFTIKTFPGADHGIRLESLDGRGQFAPGYLQTMSDWVHSKVSR